MKYKIEDSEVKYSKIYLVKGSNYNFKNRISNINKYFIDYFIKYVYHCHTSYYMNGEWNRTKIKKCNRELP